MPRAFVIRPFGQKQDSTGQAIDFEVVHRELIAPALVAAGLSGSTTVEIESAGNIRADMFALILEADVVIGDITVHNANVFYEIGVRHALRKRGTVLIKGTPSADTTPFDLLTDRYVSYPAATPKEARGALVRAIEATLRGDRVADSPIFGMMPELPEVDSATVRPLPIAFAEEVGRAIASRSKGWLRLLADDVQGRRFERAGLRMVGTAQWQLRDLPAARQSLETIRKVDPDDLDACLALANVYERLAKQEHDATLLVQSDQLIARVLTSARTDQTARVEALALRGRNLKTLWRWDFEQLGTPDARRVRAMSQQLHDSFAAYREAFQNDQNHFWSGLAALQMGAILLDLAAADVPTWRSRFDDDVTADCTLTTIQRTVDLLRPTVRSSIEAALTRLGRGSSGALWARVAQADLMFAMGADDERTFRRYAEVLPELGPFDWDAVRAQLELSASLGVRAELAARVIDAGNVQQLKAVAPKRTVIVFAGHQPDPAGQTPPRFPAAHAEAAKRAIRERLQQLRAEIAAEPDAASDAESPMIGLASAAPGGDILFHEACRELSIPTRICLPIPADRYVSEAYAAFDAWRPRLLDLMKGQNATLELSDRTELPPWLADPPKSPPGDFWERGNRWVIAMAQAFDSERTYFLALWDGVPANGQTGGTAHMVDLARAAGGFRVEVIDTNALSPLPLSPPDP